MEHRCRRSGHDGGGALVARDVHDGPAVVHVETEVLDRVRLVDEMRLDHGVRDRRGGGAPETAVVTVSLNGIFS